MSDEPTPELRALAEQLFAAGRAEAPGPALGRRLLLIEPAPTLPESRAPASDVAPRASASVSRGRRARSLGLGAAAAAIAAASVGLWGSLDQEPVFDMSPDPVSVRARPVLVAPSHPVSPPSPPPEVGAVSRHGAAPVARAADRMPELPEAPAREPERIVTSQRLQPKRAASELAPAERSRATAAAKERRTASQPGAPGAQAPAASAPVEPAPAVTLGLSEELALLKEARFALRAGEAQRALYVLDRHARARAADSLQAEASLLRIEALAALGRRAEASQLAARFVRENPFNALADRAKSFIVANGAAP